MLEILVGNVAGEFSWKTYAREFSRKTLLESSAENIAGEFSQKNCWTVQ
jgi:hypothetical protein